MVRHSTRTAKQYLNVARTPSTDTTLLPVSMIHLIHVYTRVGHINDVLLIQLLLLYTTDGCSFCNKALIAFPSEIKH